MYLYRLTVLTIALHYIQDDIIIFNYLGTHIRHIIGIRASMLHIAKQCYPQTKVWFLFSPAFYTVEDNVYRYD